MKLAIRFWFAIILVVATTSLASAQDVYNFYFQKKGKPAVEQPAPVAQEEEKEEYVEEVLEVDDDVLLVPDDWKPHQKRYKKVYVKKPEKVYVAETQNAVSTELEDEKPKKKKDDRGWQAKLGIGNVRVQNHFNTPFSAYELSQSTYVLGATYRMSKYFEVNGELHLPNGDAEVQDYSIMGNYNAEPQFSIGLGATPIHLNVFGGEFLAIGIDGGVSVGNKNSYDGSNSYIYLGPRLAMNFSESFSLMYTFRRNVSGENDFSTAALALAYRW